MATIEKSTQDSIDGQDEAFVTVKREDVIRRLSWRIKRSVSFLVVYIVIILANLFVLIWELTGTANYTASITLEALINLVFLIEVTVEIITQEKYFSTWWNRIDFSICMLCIISFVSFCVYDSVSDNGTNTVYSSSAVETFAHNDSNDEMSTTGVTVDINDVDMVLLLLRYIFQSIRLCRFMATAARRKKNQRLENDIEFPESLGEDYPIRKDGFKTYVTPNGNYETIT